MFHCWAWWKYLKQYSEFISIKINFHKHVVTLKTMSLLNETNRLKYEAVRSCVKLCYKIDYDRIYILGPAHLCLHVRSLGSPTLNTHNFAISWWIFKIRAPFFHYWQELSEYVFHLYVAIMVSELRLFLWSQLPETFSELFLQH